MTERAREPRRSLRPVRGEAMLLSVVAAVGLVSAGGWILRLPVPGWIAVGLILLTGLLLHRALDLRLRRLEGRRRPGPR